MELKTRMTSGQVTTLKRAESDSILEMMRNNIKEEQINDTKALCMHLLEGIKG